MEINWVPKLTHWTLLAVMLGPWKVAIWMLIHVHYWSQWMDTVVAGSMGWVWASFSFSLCLALTFHLPYHPCMMKPCALGQQSFAIFYVWQIEALFYVCLCWTYLFFTTIPVWEPFHRLPAVHTLSRLVMRTVLCRMGVMGWHSSIGKAFLFLPKHVSTPQELHASWNELWLWAQSNQVHLRHIRRQALWQSTGAGEWSTDISCSWQSSTCLTASSIGTFSL